MAEQCGIPKNKANKLQKIYRKSDVQRNASATVTIQQIGSNTLIQDVKINTKLLLNFKDDQVKCVTNFISNNDSNSDIKKKMFEYESTDNIEPSYTESFNIKEYDIIDYSILIIFFGLLLFIILKIISNR
jgi:hypothetical protein